MALEVPEHCQLAFIAPDAHCRAGEPHGALVQLLDSKGFQLQVSFGKAGPCIPWGSVCDASKRQCAQYWGSGRAVTKCGSHTDVKGTISYGS